MSTRLTLVCQATTRALRAATFGGDGPLDDVGRRQAAALAGGLGRVDRCWTSPALAARETAAALGLTATVEERLRDCDYGRWTGRRFDQLVLKEPFKLAAWLRDPAKAPHGGESIPEVMSRVAEWISHRTAEKGHTVAVTHAAVIRAAIVHVIGAALPSFWRIDIVPLSLTDLRTNGRRWVLRSICRTGGEETPPGGNEEAAGRVNSSQVS